MIALYGQIWRFEHGSISDGSFRDDDGALGDRAANRGLLAATGVGAGTARVGTVPVGHIPPASNQWRRASSTQALSDLSWALIA